MVENGVKHRSLYLDPRTKFVLILCCILTMSESLFSIYAMVIFFTIAILLILLGKARSSLKFLLVYLILGILPLYIITDTTGAIKIILNSTSSLVLLFSPIFIALYTFVVTSTISDIIASLQKMKLSDTVIIPFAVFCRFVPTLKEQWISIRSAMKFRNIGVSFWNTLKNPILNLEYVIIPLMMSTVVIAEELAAASISRGLAKGVKRVPLRESKIHLLDYAVCIIMIGLVVVSKVLGEGGAII